MANFIALVYATLKNEGIDTSNMSQDEAVKKFNELKGKNGGTPAEEEKIKSIDSGNNYKEFEQNTYTIAEDGSIIMDYDKFDRIMGERDKFYSNSFDELYSKIGESGKKDLTYAVDYYSSGEYEYINGMLRGQTINADEQTQKDMKRYTEKLQNAIEDFEIPENIKLYRNISITALRDLGVEEKNIKELEGMTYNEKGFSSTSMDKDVALEFGKGQFERSGDKQILFEIDVPKGKNRGIPVYNLSNFEHEQEVLLKDDSNFRINKVVKDGDSIILKGEML